LIVASCETAGLSFRLSISATVAATWQRLYRTERPIRCNHVKFPVGAAVKLIRYPPGSSATWGWRNAADSVFGRSGVGCSAVPGIYSIRCAPRRANGIGVRIRPTRGSAGSHRHNLVIQSISSCLLFRLLCRLRVTTFVAHS
jgi:hypothetical protein